MNEFADGSIVASEQEDYRVTLRFRRGWICPELRSGRGVAELVRISAAGSCFAHLLFDWK